MSAEGTAQCKVRRGAREVRGRDSDHVVKQLLENSRQISSSEGACSYLPSQLLAYRASNPTTQHRRVGVMELQPAQHRQCYFHPCHEAQLRVNSADVAARAPHILPSTSLMNG